MKQQLANFYYLLLQLPLDDKFRLDHQDLYASVCNALAQELDAD